MEAPQFWKSFRSAVLIWTGSSGCIVSGLLGLNALVMDLFLRVGVKLLISSGALPPDLPWALSLNTAEFCRHPDHRFDSHVSGFLKTPLTDIRELLFISVSSFMFILLTLVELIIMGYVKLLSIFKVIRKVAARFVDGEQCRPNALSIRAFAVLINRDLVACRLQRFKKSAVANWRTQRVKGCRCTLRVGGIFSALHGMPARTSYEKGVCLSVCQTRAL